MFKIEWHKNTGGVILTSKTTPATLGVAPRPVFRGELIMLKMDIEHKWEIPNTQLPLLWACNKQYYYKGELVFEVKGGNVYDDPVIIISDKAKGITITPIDVSKMLELNKEQLFLIESEAIEFIRDTYMTYSRIRNNSENTPSNQIDFELLASNHEKKSKTKMAIIREECDSFDIMPLETAKKHGKKIYQTTARIDKFLASFSGGKDSQVILDLCTRAMPPTAFEVIYSDTGYELPTSLELYRQVQEYYLTKYPELKFSTAKNHKEVLQYWDEIGTPSDKHRWCCSVMKTAPLYRMLKIDGTNKQAKVLTFDGVRAEESVRRAGYNRIGKAVKHNTVINASPILNWSTTEVFLYLFKYRLPINSAYENGMTRAGCLICPFSSEWNDMLSNKIFNPELSPFLDRIITATQNQGVNDIKDYVKNGNWKRRAGGRGIKTKSFVHITSTNPDLKMICNFPRKDILTWLSAVCEYSEVRNEDEVHGEIRYNKNIYRYEIKSIGDDTAIIFANTYKEPVLQGLLKRMIYKATYCIECEACEVECPTGALTILPTPRIDKNKCTHCHKCLNFHDFGCIAASSLSITTNNKNNNMKLISYNNFGLNGDWLDMYMCSTDTYFSDNTHGLHPKEQLPNFVKWLVQAEILSDTKNKNLTPSGKLLSTLYMDMPDLIWEIIWINLSYNSPIAKWYKEKVEWQTEITEAHIREMVKFDYPNDSPTTIKNIVYALFRTFRESPIGNMGLLTEIKKLTYKKEPYRDLSREALAYSIYKYAENKGIKSLRISDLFATDNTMGAFKEFGVSKVEIEKHLRSLNSENNRVLIAELNMGLDHITLRDDLTSLDVLKILTNS